MISDFILALALACIQGLTEFLPVSSSAHLLFPSLLFETKDLGLVFDIAVHAGTLCMTNDHAVHARQHGSN